MALTKYKLGELIGESFRKNSDLRFGIEYVRGISNNKEIVPTKADVDEKVIHKFYVVNPGEFVYNPRTTRMGDKVGLGYNNSDTPLLFSFNNIAFYIKDSAKDKLLPEYLYMTYRSSEFDRYAIVNSWGSATELFSFEEMCDISIELPSLDIQKKYVAIYNSLLANQKSYERGLDDLKLTCDAYIEDLRRKMPSEKIGPYIEQSDIRNNELKYGIDDIKGISIQKVFIDTKADMAGVSLRPYLLVQPDDFVYVTVTSRNGEKITLAHNTTDETYIVSSSYVVFRVKDKDVLNSDFLFMFFNRSEFDRYSRFHSWGSARETFDWADMQEVSIPIPDIKLQESIADIFEAYDQRMIINERLKQQIKDICPILIKGSIEEAQAK